MMPSPTRDRLAASPPMICDLIQDCLRRAIQAVHLKLEDLVIWVFVEFKKASLQSLPVVGSGEDKIYPRAEGVKANCPTGRLFATNCQSPEYITYLILDCP